MKGGKYMKLMTTIENGTIRIDFNPNAIGNRLEEVYNYIETSACTSKVVWERDPLALRNGILIGRYNQFATTDKMAEKAVKNIEKLFSRLEKK